MQVCEHAGIGDIVELTMHVVDDQWAAIKKDLISEAHNNLGLVLMQSGNTQKAQEEFKEAMRLKPGYAEAHYNLALALRQEGKKADAQQEFEKAYQLAPELRSVPLP